MLSWSQRGRRQVARSLYGSSVTAARAPAFYARWGVPDTLQGRFEMIALHVVLLLRRLGTEGEVGRRLGVAVSEAFVVDMDDGMRELTFGDLAVPREIKRAAAALLDRNRAYRQALEARQPSPLLEALEAQMAYLVPAGRLDAARLAHYMLEVAQCLDRQSGSALLAGRLGWPVPGAHAAPGTWETQTRT
jgi:cytochrome b pre-mRNA-processing protein 3